MQNILLEKPKCEILIQLLNEAERNMSGKNISDEIKKQLAKAMLTDDEFFRIAMEDKEACQRVIRVITGKHDLIVKEIFTQKEFANLFKRTAILDVFCEDSTGRLINIEMQRGKNVAHLRRVRYHISLIDTHFFGKGKKFKELPNICIIYINTFDPFSDGKTMYHIRPAVVETGRFLDNGIEVIFINTAVDDGSEQAELMRYFKSFAGGEKFPALADRVNYLKNTREGHMGLSGFVKKAAKESRAEGRAEGALKICADMVKNFIKNTGNSIEAAFKILCVPEEMRPQVMKMI